MTSALELRQVSKVYGSGPTEVAPCACRISEAALGLTPGSLDTAGG
jgi:hypothetical protein